MSTLSGPCILVENIHNTDTEGLAAAEVPCAAKMQKEGLKVLGDRLLMLVKIKEREES